MSHRFRSGDVAFVKVVVESVRGGMAECRPEGEPGADTVWVPVACLEPDNPDPTAGMPAWSNRPLLPPHRR